MNIGFLGPAVATVLTACGIETKNNNLQYLIMPKLQQYLPLAVLKPENSFIDFSIFPFVKLQQYLPLVVLKHAITTDQCFQVTWVATVLTACGIETRKVSFVPRS